MTETSQVWDGILVGDATVAPYSALEWAAREKLLHGQGVIFPNYGVLKGSGDGTYSPLNVNAKSPASTNVAIQVGAALVNGRLYENTASFDLTVGANASGNARIDTVVLRVDYVAQTIRAVIKQGTPAASPVRPTLQQDASIWEMPLADIAVANGFVSISQANITNRQRAIHSLTNGWLPYAYPLNHVINGDYTGGSFSLGAGPNSAIAVPVMLNANMLLHDIVFRNVVTADTWNLEWGFYFEDVNDGNTAENTLRLVANGLASVTTTGSGNFSIVVAPAPQVLSPGLYWFVLQNKTTTNLPIGRIAASALDTTPFLFRNAGLSNIPQTLDMVTGWSTSTDKLGIYFRGRVFGKSTVL